MNYQRLLSALAELGQSIYIRAGEARETAANMRRMRQHYHAHALDARVAALVEVGNDIDRARNEAQKADVGQAHNGGSMQRMVGRHLTWREEPPRAAGWWWHWVGDEDVAPIIYDVDYNPTEDQYQAALPWERWDSESRKRDVREVGGWWCGPLEYPEPPLVAMPPNA